MVFIDKLMFLTSTIKTKKTVCNGSALNKQRRTRKSLLVAGLHQLDEVFEQHVAVTFTESVSIVRHLHVITSISIKFQHLTARNITGQFPGRNNTKNKN